MYFRENSLWEHFVMLADENNTRRSTISNAMVNSLIDKECKNLSYFNSTLQTILIICFIDDQH